MSTNRRAGTAAAVMALTWSTSVLAQDGSGGTTDAMADLSATGFVAAEPGTGDQIDGGMLMIAGYGVFWALIFGYVFILARRQRRVAGELEELRRRMEDLDDRLDDAEGQA